MKPLNLLLTWLCILIVSLCCSLVWTVAIFISKPSKILIFIIILFIFGCSLKLPMRKIVIDAVYNDSIEVTYTAQSIQDTIIDRPDPIVLKDNTLVDTQYKQLYIWFIPYNDEHYQIGDTLLIRLHKSGYVKIMKRLNKR